MNQTFAVKKSEYVFNPEKGVFSHQMTLVQEGLSYREAKDMCRRSKGLSMARESAAVRQAREQEQADAG